VSRNPSPTEKDNAISVRMIATNDTDRDRIIESKSFIELTEYNIRRRICTLKKIFSLRSRRKHKAWGASPRIDMKIVIEPAKRAAATTLGL
jgi:hypothetical protein